MPIVRRFLSAILGAAVLLALAACAPQDAAPTVTPEELYGSAYNRDYVQDGSEPH